jgi:hypothetical protein
MMHMGASQCLQYMALESVNMDLTMLSQHLQVAAQNIHSTNLEEGSDPYYYRNTSEAV